MWLVGRAVQARAGVVGCGSMRGRRQQQQGIAHSRSIARSGRGTSRWWVRERLTGDEEGAVVRDELVLDLLLRGLVDVLLVVGDDGLADRLADGVNLGDVATTADADADVDVGETGLAEEEDRLVDLDAEDLRLEELERLAVHLNEAASALAVSDRNSVL